MTAGKRRAKQGIPQRTQSGIIWYLLLGIVDGRGNGIDMVGHPVGVPCWTYNVYKNHVPQVWYFGGSGGRMGPYMPCGRWVMVCGELNGDGLGRGNGVRAWGSRA